ncbi:MAG: branched-chain alpha-keto acid dehydrogenase subunit E2, partial [Pseudomonadota bacterium]
MWRSIASNAISFLIVALFLTGGVILWGRGEYVRTGPLDKSICFQVPRGSNFDKVSKSLAEKGAVTNASILRLGADYSAKMDDLKFGSFLIEAGSSMEEIVDVVTRGGANTCGVRVVYTIGVTRVLAEVRELDPESNRFVEVAEFNIKSDETPAEYADAKTGQDTEYQLTLAEGVTSWQIVDGLRNIDILEGEVPEVPPEGALAPDSYEVTRGQDRNAILGQMREQQELLVSAAWEARDADVPLESP